MDVTERLAIRPTLAESREQTESIGYYGIRKQSGMAATASPR